MKKYVKKILTEVIRESPEVFGNAVQDSILEIDPKKRYLIMLPGDETDLELIESLLESLTPKGTNRNVFAILADNVKIIEVS